MYQLKPISPGSLKAALEKAERYRLLNEPGDAESICRDILGVDPEDWEARLILILTLIDQIPQEPTCFPRALEEIASLDTPYERAYYAATAWERHAKALYASRETGAGRYVYDEMARALALFQEAERLKPEDDDSAILRWNACVRFLQRHKDLESRSDEIPEPILSE